LIKEGKIGQVRGISQLGVTCFNWPLL